MEAGPAISPSHPGPAGHVVALANPMTLHPDAPTPKPARILLGAFILWQLFFLVSFNLLSLLPRVRGYWKDKPSAEVIAPEWLHEKGRLADAERVLTTLN